MKRKNEHIKNLSRQLGNNPKLKSKLLSVKIEDILYSIFGDIGRQYILGVRLRGNIAHIYVSSSTFKHELHYNRIQLKERINSNLENEEIQDIMIHG